MSSKISALTAATGLKATDQLPIVQGGANKSITPPAMANSIALQLPKWRAALAKVKAGTSNARILAVGDSTTSGAYSNNSTSGDWYGLSWPSQLARMLNASGVNAYSDSFMGFVTYLSNIRLNAPAPWTTNVATIGGCYIASGPAGTSTMTYTPTNPVDTFKLWCLTTPGAGSLLYNVNGSGGGTMNQNVANSLTSVTPTCPLGINTLNMAGNGAGNAFVAGIEAWNSTIKSVNIINAGWSGGSATNWNDATYAYSPKNFNVLSPDLTLISLGINDWTQGISVSTFSTNVQALITQAKLTGDVVLITPNPTEVANTIPLATQALYAAALYALAATNNIPIVDLFNRWVSYEISNPLGYYRVAGYPQSVHPVAAGYADYAQAIFNVIGNA